jgi:uncharacterized MAPEG superfamily protein
MSVEFFWLALTVIMTGLIWVPYMLDRFMVGGVGAVLANQVPTPAAQSTWASRTMAAHQNAVENLVVFATLVLMLNAMTISTAATVGACVTYFWARLVHLVSYWLGIPGIRTLAFLVGFAAQVVLALALFGLA